MSVKRNEIPRGDSFGSGDKENKITDITIFTGFVTLLESSKVKSETMYKT